MAPRTPHATGEGARQGSAPRGRRASGEVGGDKLNGRAPEGVIGPVETAALAEIQALGVEPATSAIAASALELARQLDNPRNSATAKSMCAGRLQEALDRLLELNPPKPEATPLDRIREDRALRLAAPEG